MPGAPVDDATHRLDRAFEVAVHLSVGSACDHEQRQQGQQQIAVVAVAELVGEETVPVDHE